ncbi:hypothetical protein SAMN06893096_10795 [Geodermatophilus pulveris]|uniref:DUF4352 domain-containing protein n=1 Tax=Geodermatophilus pulveris TaxID=1564159 RepID=A0A239GWD5_9ACTN|nr:hypothetical protein [Geodermatophilus pulveris]SNS73536.1 hypothetical protein SAMN06893096_10795 [Geodermatophilus pulveris]
MSPLGNGRPAPSRRREVVGGVAAALVVIAVVVVGLLLRGGGGDGGGDVAAAGTATPSAEAPAAPGTPAPPSGEPAPPPPAPALPDPAATPVVADELPPSLPAVALDRPAEADDGVAASLTALEAVDGTGTGPGDVAGPAVRVTVELRNGTAAPLDLLGVAVDLTHGPERVPASPLGDPSARAFSGTLAPGAVADGVYVFRVPADARDLVTVSVSPRPGAPYLVFEGAAP